MGAGHAAAFAWTVSIPDLEQRLTCRAVPATAWRATANVLAAQAVAAVGGILLGGLALVWVAAIGTRLARSSGTWFCQR